MRPDDPLIALPGVVATPHLGASTGEAQVNVAVAIAEQVIAFLKRGAIISAQPRHAEPKPADRTITDIARRYEGRYSAEIHQNDDRAAGAEFVASHVRRLEALRRVAGLVEREADGSWRVPDKFLEAVDAYEARRVRDAPVVVEVLSTAALEKQVTAV